MVPIGIHWSWMSDGLDLYFACICIVLFFYNKDTALPFNGKKRLQTWTHSLMALTINIIVVLSILILHYWPP